MQAFVPYLKTKLDQVFLRLQAIDDATPLGWWRGAGAGRLVAVLFFRTHPYFKCIWEVSVLIMEGVAL